jgi:hypothetical protein
MRFHGYLATFLMLGLNTPMPADAQQSIDAKVQTIKDALVTLCVAGGSTSELNAKGDLELSSKIKDILTGNIGGKVGGETQFKKTTWEGIIGGISKDMTALQGQEADAARKCMVDNGFALISMVISEK